MDIAAYLARVEATLENADADLLTDLGGHHETTNARLWRGQVLVDWEPDPSAGDCLLRLELLKRLIALHAQVEVQDDAVRIIAPGRVVASLSSEHTDLVARLGGARRVELRATLRFHGQEYRGGDEAYYVVERGQRVALLRINADVRPRRTREALPRTSRAPT